MKLSKQKQLLPPSKFETGCYYNLAESVYRADPALSTSDLKLIENPYEFHQKIKGNAPAIDSPAMRFGRLVHSLILEPDEFKNIYSVCPEDRENRRLVKNRDWWKEQEQAGKEIVKQVDVDDAKAMSRQFWRLPIVRDLKEYKTELSVFAKNYRGICDVKCRIDMKSGPIVIDLKTTAAGGAHPRKFVYKARDLKYLWQQVNYTDMCKAAGVEIEKWYWAVVETKWPYKSSLIEFTPRDLDTVRKELDEAYDTLKNGIKHNSWPDYTPDEPVTVSMYGVM